MGQRWNPAYPYVFKALRPRLQRPWPEAGAGACYNPTLENGAVMPTAASPLSAILTDIEGTTTSIAFVYDILFPYAAARLERTCGQPDPGRPELREALAQLRSEYAQEAAADPPPPFGDGSPYARWLMERDRKSTGLKLLQGLIWDEGYAQGEIRGHVYPDVPPALKAWREQGRRLRVFSSGSVHAQKLLFGHTD